MHKLSVNIFPIGGRSAHIGEAGHDDGGSLSLLLRWEHIPESESLVAGSSHQGLTIWARCKVEHTVRVACQSGQLLH